MASHVRSSLSGISIFRSEGITVAESNVNHKYRSADPADSPRV